MTPETLYRIPISPAAREVLAAAGEDPAARRIAAAVLQAVADQSMHLDPCNIGDKIAQDYWDAGYNAAVEEIKDNLSRIAGELRSADG